MGTSKNSVVIFLPQFVGGGLERVALHQGQGLVHRGFHVTFVVGMDGGELLPEVEKDFKVHKLHTPHVFRGFHKLAQFLRDEKPDILISHYLLCNLAAALATLFSSRRTPLVLFEHGLFWQSLRRYPIFLRFVIRGLLAILYRQANQIVVVSKAVADEVHRKSFIPRSRIQIIYNPVIPKDFDARLRDMPNHPWLSKQHNYKIILALGRLVEPKGFQYLIRAYAKVRLIENAKLIIFGDGPYRNKLLALLEELGLMQDVSLPGYCDNIFPILKRADVFVLPSIHEAFGNVVVEALACGTPVVSTNIGGPVEILENGKYGRLVPAQDPEKLAEAIIESLHQEVDHEVLRMRGLSFTIDKACDAYTSLIRDVLDKQVIST